MTCNRVTNHLDDYLDGGLPATDRHDVEAHLDTCPDCREVIQRERELRRALGALPVSAPSPDFFDRALQVAAREGSRDSHHRGWGWGFGTAVAAGLALWLVIGMVLQRPEVEQSAQLAGVSIAMHESHTVNLVFASLEELEDATLTVQLPPGIELQGFGDRQQIRWRTNLRKGKNVLPLELVARDISGGELVARLEHGDKQRTFRVQLTVSDVTTLKRWPQTNAGSLQS